MHGHTSLTIQATIYAINEAFRAHKSSTLHVITPIVSTISTPEVILKSPKKLNEE